MKIKKRIRLKDWNECTPLQQTTRIVLMSLGIVISAMLTLYFKTIVWRGIYVLTEYVI